MSATDQPRAWFRPRGGGRPLGRGRSSLAALVLCALLAGCGGDEDPATQSTERTGKPGLDAPPQTTPQQSPAGPLSAGDDPAAPDDEIEDRPGGPGDEAALRTVRAYVAALNAHDGAVLCRLIAPAALRRVELPVRRGSCAASLSASIGYRNPRGSPRFLRTKIAGSPALARTPYGARATVPLRTDFADRGYVSREDDIVHLLPRGEAWLIAKPSVVFFRAIGRANAPPSVLAPPR